MSFLPKTLLAGALAAGALALPATAAHAATYCAHNAGFTCPAGSIKVGTDLQKALKLASDTPVADTVVIGPGSFASPASGWAVTSDAPLVVRGSGGTVLDGGSREGTWAVFKARNATLEKLTLELPNADQNGIETRGGTLRDLAVIGTGNHNVGIDAYGSTIDAVNVQIQGPGAGIRVRADYYATTIRRSTLTAERAVFGYGGEARISRSQMRGSVNADWGTLTVTDSRIWLSSPGAGLLAQCQTGKSAKVVANHVTVRGGTGTVGASAECTGYDESASTTVRNSILATEKGLYRLETAGRSDVLATWNVLPPGQAAYQSDAWQNTGSMVLSGNVLAVPKFYSEFTLTLGKGSAGLDAAKPHYLTTDLDAFNRPRPKDGNGDGIAVADMGALERPTP